MRYIHPSRGSWSGNRKAQYNGVKAKAADAGPPPEYMTDKARDLFADHNSDGELPQIVPAAYAGKGTGADNKLNANDARKIIKQVNDDYDAQQAKNQALKDMNLIGVYFAPDATDYAIAHKITGNLLERTSTLQQPYTVEELTAINNRQL